MAGGRVMAISDKQLQQHLDRLPVELTPERDLWQGIEKAINQRSNNTVVNKRNIMPYAWAASVLVAVLVTWMNVSPMNQTSQMPSLIAAINQDFNQQKQLMLTSFGSPDITRLPVDMQAELKKLEQARGTIEAALANDENNADLLNLLQWTQQQELDLIKRLYAPQWQTI